MPPRKHLGSSPTLSIDHLHDCVEEMKTKVADLHADVATLKGDLKKNTEVTEQVRDILGTFKVTMAAGKLLAAIVAAVGGTVAAIKGWRQ